MIADTFRVEPASWQHDQADLRAVREQVFIVEQAIPAEEEWDVFDERARHVIARDDAGRPIGTGRLLPPRPASGDEDPPVAATPASIGRMAVLPEWRGHGVGAAIMRVLLEQARALGYPEIELHAQTHAIPFYATLGFEAYGEEFDECGIPHRMMRRALDPPAAREPAPLPPHAQPRLLAAQDSAQARAAIAELLVEARHEVMIYTRDLDPALLDVAAALDEIKRVALSGRHARIRVIIHDARAPLVAGHRLLALAQRLSSTFELRTPTDERDQQYPSAFVLNDCHGYFFRPLGSRPDGDGATHAPGRHGQLRALFDQVWERSAPSDELRRLAF
jgi:predicted GNAT family N-acyltransferase